MKAIIEYFLNKSIFLNLLTVLIVLIGIYKAASMNREAFPNIDFDIVTVTTIYPGASPAEVEKLVTKPIEDVIKSVDGIKEYRSASIENRSGIVIVIDPNTEDTKKVVDDIKSAVDRVQDLPEDIDDKPLVQEITSSRTPVIEVSLGVKKINGEAALTEMEFREKIRILEDMILEIPEVGRIARRGYRKGEMKVEINPVSMDRYFLSPQQVVNALKTKNINFPGGNITSDGKESFVRTIGEFDTPEEIEEVYIRSNDAGRAIKVKDVAKVTEDFEDHEFLEKSNGLRAISLTVIKKETGDAVRVVDEVKKTVQKFQEQHKKELHISYINDLSKYIRRRLGILVNNGLTGLVLVVVSLFVFLGWRIAFMVAIGLPVTIALTFITLDIMGVTLNLISMFGLIIVIGMIVDDAIIISENIFRYIEEGVEILEACVQGTLEVISPVSATITTTIAAFGPLLFMTGIFGKFVYFIPLGVVVALLASLVEAFFILPSHIYDINRLIPEKNVGNQLENESKWFIRFRERYYRPFLAWTLDHKFITMFVLNIVFFSVLVAGKVFGDFKLFPGGIDAFIIKLETETGSTLEETEKFTKAIEKEVSKLTKDELEDYVTRVGIIQKNPNDPFTKRGKNFAMILVYLTPESGREIKTEEIINRIRNKTYYLLNEEALENVEAKYKKNNSKENKQEPEDLKTKITKFFTQPKVEANPLDSMVVPPEFAELEGKLVALEYEKVQGGPPVGKPVAIQIKGDDFDTMKEIAKKYKTVIGEIDGITDIDDDYVDGKDEIRLKIDEKLAARTGVSVLQIGTAINTAFQGTIATTIKRPDEEVDVRVRFPESYRQSVNALDKVFVTNMTGNLIPVSKMISYEKTPGIMSINHLDGTRLLTVTANVDEKKIQSREANLKAMEKSKGIMEDYPGYQVIYGGENKDTEESMESLVRAFGFALLFIFMILASLFSSLMQPLIIVMMIPFALIGVIIAFLTHGHVFSFLSFVGLIGLSGIVVNDSIVLVDFANQFKKRYPELDVKEILIKAGTVRLRPVILTTITTVLGILPTAYGIGGSDPFLIPMALAIGWGLVFASFLTLVVVPIMYYMLYKIHIWFTRKVFLKSALFLKNRQENNVKNV